MPRKLTVQSPKESGFALIMSLIVVGVLISIGLTVLELTVAQVRLSTNARDSERAFHAANAGAECALYIRRQNADEMETGGTISPTCFGVPATNNTLSTIVSNANGEAYLYNYNFTWGSGNDRCSAVTALVASTTPNGAGLTINNMNNHVPGYPATGGSLTCVPGARCTVMSIRGYSRDCSRTNTYGTAQREVLLQL